MSLGVANIYTDFSGFARLRADARASSGAGRRAVAEQMEALFIGMMVKSMRAGAGGGAFGTSTAGVAQGLYDSQLALHLSRGGRLGFADMLLREFNAAPGADPSPGGAAPAAGFPAPARNPFLTARVPQRSDPEPAPAPAAAATVEPAAPAAPPRPTPPAPAAEAAAAAPAAAPSAAEPGRWDTPEEFVHALWPAAERAARALGTRPEAVLAVAALETGWGRHMPARDDGTPSYNLFGIKAHGWAGDVTRSSTLEFEAGAFTRKVEPFRAYPSPEAAFDDFAAFIKGQPRYRQALQLAGDPVAFVHALHRAGYATDPRYGDKLEAIVGSEPLRPVRLAGAADGAQPVTT